MQQFHPQTKPWIAYTRGTLLQNSNVGHCILDKFRVVEQIIFQSLTILALFGLIYTIIRKIYKNNLG